MESVRHVVSNANEQCINMEFCYKFGKTAKKMHPMLMQVYGANTGNKNMFMTGANVPATERKLHDDPRSSLP